MDDASRLFDGAGGDAAAGLPAPPVAPLPVREPFAPLPRSLPAGLRAPVLAGGTALAVLAVGVLVLLVSAGPLFDFVLAQSEKLILAKLDDETPPVERRRLELAFAGAAEAVRAGRVDADSALELRRVLLELFPLPEGPLSDDELGRLAEALEALPVSE